MKNKYIYFALSFIFLSCSKDSEIKPKNDLKIESSNLLDSLTKGYTGSSQAELFWFLDTWNIEYISNEDSVNRDGGTAKDVYAIFKLIYKPFNINELGEHEWENIYTGAKYIVVQDIIYYNFNYNNTIHEENDSVVNFRPDINFDNTKILYYSNKYSDIIQTFLSHGKEMEMMEGYDEETLKRARYLNEGIYIFPGHWGGYWHIITHPELSIISFNADKTKAKAYFRILYMFGEAEFEKEDGEWKLKNSAITGIE